MKSLFYPECGPMPYESILSIYLKISHSNFIELTDLRKKIGGLWVNGKSGRMLITHKIEECLEDNIQGIAHHLPWKYAPAIALSSPASLMFCTECVKFGYHSVFNSICLHRVCPLHKRALSLACDACRRHFFKGFSAAHSIPRALEVCSKCGFQDIGLRREIKMRRSPKLQIALDYFGRAQARWYREIYGLYTAESGYSGLYYQSNLARAELSGPGERLFDMQSPESLAGRRQFSPPIACVSWFRTYLHDRLYRTDSPFHLADYLRLHSQREILNRLKVRFLGKHMRCYKEGCEIVGYPDGQPRTRSFCPLTVAFILVCLKMSYNTWPTPGSDFHDFSLKGSRNKESAPLLTSWSYREAVLVFLTILARLEYYVSEGQDFFVICRSEVIYFPDDRGVTLLRKSSYKFRCNCRNPQRRHLLSRNGAGGALIVECATQGNHVDGSSNPRQLVV